MTTKKQLKIAKTMLKRSLNPDGSVANQKVRQVLQQNVKEKPIGFLRILKYYKKLIGQALSKEEIIIESATKITSDKLEKELLFKTGARKVSKKINPNIVLGAKITNGDWVFDATLDAKLEQLTKV